MKRWLEQQLDIFAAVILFGFWSVVHRYQLRDEISLECAVRVVQRARERITTGGYSWPKDERGRAISPMVGDYDGGSPHEPPRDEQSGTHETKQAA